MEIKFYSYLDKEYGKTNFEAASQVITNKEIQAPSLLFIRNNSWNDYGFYTEFRVIYLREDNVLQDLGEVKIIQSDLNEDAKVTLPETFQDLDENIYILKGSKIFYDSLNDNFNERDKNKILSSLNDFYYNNLNRKKVIELNPEFKSQFDMSLFRDQVVSFEQEYFKIAKESLNSTKTLIDKFDSCLEENPKRTFIYLTYTSIIITLESFLGDLFRFNVIKGSYFNNFVQSYTKLDKKYTIKEFQDLDIKKIVEEEINSKLLFHKIATVIALYKDILNIDIGENLNQFAEPIQNRHDIVHRNGRTMTGDYIEIEVTDILKLHDDVLQTIESINGKLELSRIRNN